MPRFRVSDIHMVETAPTSPGNLRNKLSEMILSSTTCRAKVDAINPETGEYRVVVQGTLGKEENRFENL